MKAARPAVTSMLVGSALAALAWAAVELRGGPSLGLRAATLVASRRNLLGDPEAARAALLSRSYPQPAAVRPSMHKALDVREGSIAGCRVFTISPRKQISDWHIVYYHGGAYVRDLVPPHWNLIQALVAATGATVTVPIYPLAPEFSHRDAFRVLADIYQDLLNTTDPTEIILAGDSAGGGLAVGHALELKATGLPLPARLILFAPWLDITLADETARSIEPSDIMLKVDPLRECGSWWAGGDDPKLPRLSPLYADLTGLPPIDIYQGDRDILVIDSRSFAARAKAAGSLGRYDETSGGFHVFMAATFTREAKDVFAKIEADLRTKRTQA